MGGSTTLPAQVAADGDALYNPRKNGIVYALRRLLEVYDYFSNQMNANT
jgi:hypothetical protein